MNTGLWKEIREFVKKIDPKSWPAFFMFAVVLAGAGTLNYTEMAKAVPPVTALLISMFFGIGVLAWHIVENRTDDSQKQEDVALFTKWLNAVLDGTLLVVNLLRAEFPGFGYDVTAFVIVGISAASHVTAYLLWTQYNPRRINQKELERGLNDVQQRGERSKIQIKKTEERLSKLKWIEEEALRLHTEYDGKLPAEKVNRLISEMRTAAMKEMEDVRPQDLGQTNAQVAYAQTADRTPVPATQTGGNAPHVEFTWYDMPAFLKAMNLTEAQARTRWHGKSRDDFAADVAEKLDISGKNMRKLYYQLFPTQAGSRSQ